MQPLIFARAICDLRARMEPLSCIPLLQTVLEPQPSVKRRGLTGTGRCKGGVDGHILEKRPMELLRVSEGGTGLC